MITQLSPSIIRQMADSLEGISLNHTWEPYQFKPDESEEHDYEIRDYAAYMIRDCADIIEQYVKRCSNEMS